MGTFILKRKLYSDDEKSGSNLGKIALGTGIAAAGAFAAGRRGLLGQNIAKSTNVAWGKLGNAFGSRRMVTNASRKYFEHGLGNEVSKEALKNSNLGKEWSKSNFDFRKKVGAEDLFKPKTTTPKPNSTNYNKLNNTPTSSTNQTNNKTSNITNINTKETRKNLGLESNNKAQIVASNKINNTPSKK